MIRILSPFGWVVVGVFVFWTVLLLWICGAIAAPYLAVDCTPEVDEVTSFQLQFGTQPWVNTQAVMLCGNGPSGIICFGKSRTMCYDMVVVPIGVFSVKGRASNPWGQSGDSATFYFAKAVPSPPSFYIREVRTKDYSIRRKVK